ncbi:predicted protein [Nematostella vectensis]|uniref:Uncharacterized protein n=1 Tax=Nematostella vectensis TaxID=45351 RepID=A7RG63_NEMVE|nr:uncharacterized protein LOC5521649 [Nematostella vectensis]EDO49366.1 predicted protein [Nematostella vectensis]|eukprot:XP_001641429.1 predicted protein [Nematostella vectensis]
MTGRGWFRILCLLVCIFILAEFINAQTTDRRRSTSRRRAVVSRRRVVTTRRRVVTQRRRATVRRRRVVTTRRRAVTRRRRAIVSRRRRRGSSSSSQRSSATTGSIVGIVFGAIFACIFIGCICFAAKRSGSLCFTVTPNGYFGTSRQNPAYNADGCTSGPSQETGPVHNQQDMPLADLAPYPPDAPPPYHTVALNKPSLQPYSQMPPVEQTPPYPTDSLAYPPWDLSQPEPPYPLVDQPSAPPSQEAASSPPYHPPSPSQDSAYPGLVFSTASPPLVQNNADLGDGPPPPSYEECTS